MRFACDRDACFSEVIRGVFEGVSLDVFTSRRAFGNVTLVKWGTIPLRLIVGFGFMQHGFSKLAADPHHFAAMLNAIGVPEPGLMAYLTILTEIFGGLAVLLGAFVAFAALPMAIVLVIPIFTVQWPNGFSSIKLLAVTASGAQFGPPGYETNLLYLACLATIVVMGSGPLAIDGLIKKRNAGNASTPAHSQVLPIG